MFRNIYKVQSGHYITLDLGSWKLNSVKYWEPDFETDLFHTEKYYISELQKILNDTIEQQMRSDVPIGTYLSGGIDSSLVTIMSSGFSKIPLKSFSGAFHEGPEFNELQYARIAAQRANAELLKSIPHNRNLQMFYQN
jgi:asparagine synthase (glutamine-hydrolysing)